MGIMEIPNSVREMQPVDTDSAGFIAIFEDGSQVDTTSDVDENGVTIGLGNLGDDGDWSDWSEIRISWNAVQAVADELNEMLRQARKADWL